MVVHDGNVKHLDGCISHLAKIGFSDDGINVVCGKGISVPNLAYVAKRRDLEKLTEAQTWVFALDTISEVYSSTDEMFLFVSPDMRVWDKLKLFCDYTVEQEFTAIYLPYTPIRYFLESDFKTIPCESLQAAWCEVKIDEPSHCCNAMVLNRRSARLLACYLKDATKRNPGLWDWPDLFQFTVGNLFDVICYAARPSFAKSSAKVPVEFVGDFDQKGVDVRKNRYLN